MRKKTTRWNEISFMIVSDFNSISFAKLGYFGISIFLSQTILTRFIKTSFDFFQVSSLATIKQTTLWLKTSGWFIVVLVATRNSVVQYNIKMRLMSNRNQSLFEWKQSANDSSNDRPDFLTLWQVHYDENMSDFLIETNCPADTDWASETSSSKLKACLHRLVK